VRDAVAKGRITQTLPVPGLGSVVDRERPVVDGEHWLLKPWPPALLALMGSAVITTGAQR
jgi:hypothetical protein